MTDQRLQKRIVLASGSRTRGDLLRRAGLIIEQIRPDFDEAAAKIELAHKPPAELAQALANGKALSVTGDENTIVIGADQVLVCGDRLFDKPTSIDEAIEHLRHLRNRDHRLISALTLVRHKSIILEYQGVVELRMRDFSEEFLAGYVKALGEQVLSSVGGYQYESLGAQLFERVTGDYFDVLGLPLLPLLKALRDLHWIGS